ncbi:hypothetical protein MYX04_01370 [Nitrospiraceae bacterium AH_259_D15_M11_P09]|nr:hypothetical protein [Nitrospiraceae bacterium AH_259_D15_M11_P09]
MADESADSIQGWTGKRRSALVRSILKGETAVAESACKHGSTMAEAEDWRDRFLQRGENTLRMPPKDDEAFKDGQIKKLKQKIGDLVLDNGLLREALKPYPLARGRPDEQDSPCRSSRNGGPVSCCTWRWSYGAAIS